MMQAARLRQERSAISPRRKVDDSASGGAAAATAA